MLKIVYTGKNNSESWTKELLTEESLQNKKQNGCWSIGVKEVGKKRCTWIPYKADKYSHNVTSLKIYDADTNRLIEEIECIQ